MEQIIQSTQCSTSHFNNSIWRNSINEAYKQLNYEGLLNIISPFGFEVLNNKKYLSGNLRKFYVYIGITQSNETNTNEIASKFRENLFNILQIDMPEFLMDIVAIIENQTVTTVNTDNYQCKPVDKLIDIQVRQLSKGEDILTDYANYLICTINAILEQKGEAQLIEVNPIMRSRMFQLYLMIETIFKQYLPQLSHQEKLLFQSAPKYISNKIDAFFDEKLTKKYATEHELRVYENLVLPRLKKLKQVIKPHTLKSTVNINLNSYHHPSQLTAVIDKTIYTEVQQYIIKTYKDYI